MSILGSQTSSNALRVAFACLLLSTGACAYGELRQVLRAQVASETDCPEIAVKKSPPFQPGYKDNQYLVKGCGIDRVYTCPNDGMMKYGNAGCTYVNAGSAITATAPPPAPAPMDDMDEPADDMGGGEPPAAEPPAAPESSDDTAGGDSLDEP